MTCKESGIAVPFLLLVYWWLFRRKEAMGPWVIFLGSVANVTALFLAARFHFVTASNTAVIWLGGSFWAALLTQLRLWVFMLGKLVWPSSLSADYTIDDVSGISIPIAAVIFTIVIVLHAWLAAKSRLGALGVATFWLGLATVSNFIPPLSNFGGSFLLSAVGWYSDATAGSTADDT